MTRPTLLAAGTHDCLAAVAAGHTSPKAVATAAQVSAVYAMSALERLAKRQGFVRRVRRGQYVLTPAGITYLQTTLGDE
ncbi:hypothetical protein [Tsukamurella pulmonis]|uniref:hypothetical protein n=1 Tax=Tsukamurella pulmonis TaxID=47312 RepID=UPI001112A178|nr:hypothetical protein [Tsukamurella pulmonis]